MTTECQQSMTSLQYAAMLCKVCLDILNPNPWHLRGQQQERSSSLPPAFVDLENELTRLQILLLQGNYSHSEPAVQDHFLGIVDDLIVSCYRSRQHLGDRMSDLLHSLYRIAAAIRTAAKDPSARYDENGFPGGYVALPDPMPGTEWTRQQCALYYGKTLLARVEHLSAGSRILIEGIAPGATKDFLPQMISHLRLIVTWLEASESPRDVWDLAIEQATLLERNLINLATVLDPPAARYQAFFGDIGCLQEALLHAKENPEGSRLY